MQYISTELFPREQYVNYWFQLDALTMMGLSVSTVGEEGPEVVRTELGYGKLLDSNGSPQVLNGGNDDAIRLLRRMVDNLNGRMIFAFAPGAKRTAVAWGTSTVLIGCAWWPSKKMRTTRGAHVAIETRTRYSSSLVTVIHSIEAHTADAASHDRVPKVQWTGDEPKPICHRRVWNSLIPMERYEATVGMGMRAAEIGDKISSACERYEKTGKVTQYSWHQQNILDAIGIFLYAARGCHQIHPPSLHSLHF